MFKKLFMASILAISWPAFTLAGTKWAHDLYFEVEPIKIKDPLSVLVGSTRPGEEIFEIGLTDVGMYIGHICPCVAGAYRVTQLALELLYKNELPERGGIRVAANSPSAALDVASYITGARSFYGCEERHRGDLAVDRSLESNSEDMIVTFQRKDTDEAVKVVFHKSILCSQEEKAAEETVKEKIMEGEATEEEVEWFWKTKQKEVKLILFNPPVGLFEVERLNSYTFPEKDGGE